MKDDIRKRIRLILACAIALLLLAACGGSDGDSTPAGTGSLKTLLSDSSTEDYRAVYVTVARVDVHSATDTWQTVATPNGTYNLLALVNGVREELGLSPLTAGHYTQMRLILGTTPQPQATNLLNQLHPFANYLIDQNSAVHELKVPSGLNSGIKIVQGFDISDNQTTELILDFDAMKSVVKAGASGQHLLKPTIKMLSTRDAALVSGRVRAGTDGIEGALVSAQLFTNDLTLDAADRVSVIRSTLGAADDLSTLEDETGAYRLELPVGDYNLVAYYTGYQPVCASASLSPATPRVQDFALQEALTGSVTGGISVTNASTDQHVTLDVRQAGHCDNPATMISIKTLQLAGAGPYAVTLPIGDYQIIASTNGATTLVATISVNQNMATVHNIAF